MVTWWNFPSYATADALLFTARKPSLIAFATAACAFCLEKSPLDGRGVMMQKRANVFIEETNSFCWDAEIKYRGLFLVRILLYLYRGIIDTPRENGYVKITSRSIIVTSGFHGRCKRKFRLESGSVWVIVFSKCQSKSSQAFISMENLGKLESFWQSEVFY